MCVCVCVCVSALIPLRVSCVCVCVLVFALTEDRLLLISFRRGVSGAPGLFIQRHFTEYGFFFLFDLGKFKRFDVSPILCGFVLTLGSNPHLGRPGLAR